MDSVVWSACVGNDRHDDIDPSFNSLRKSVTTCSKFVT